MTALAQAFASSFLAVFEIFIVIFAAGILVRRNVLKASHIEALSSATVVIFLPCLIFSNVLTNLDPVALPFWWVIPLVAILMTTVGLLLGALGFIRELDRKRDMLPLASMQNAGYLVLPIGLALAPAEFDQFALYCFLFILGYNPVLWSVGTYLVGGRGKGHETWRAFLTPPFLANLIAIGLVVTKAHAVIPAPALAGIKLMGQAAVPVATLVLGGVLGSVPIRVRSYLWDAVRVIGIKLVLLPLVTIVTVSLLDLHTSHPVLARFLVIEAAAAPAVGLILQVKTYGGNEQKVGSLMLLSYIACIFTLPFWIAIWELIVG
ncbi:MAG: permease [bacterium]|nr:permease [bacterium]